MYRYAHRQPYGEWLKRQVVSMKAILDSVPEGQRKPHLLAPPAAPASPAGSNGHASNGHAAPAQEAGLMQLLKPLKVFG